MKELKKRSPFTKMQISSLFTLLLAVYAELQFSPPYCKFSIKFFLQTYFSYNLVLTQNNLNYSSTDVTILPHLRNFILKIWRILISN